MFSVGFRMVRKTQNLEIPCSQPGFGLHLILMQTYNVILGLKVIQKLKPRPGKKRGKKKNSKILQFNQEKIIY